jgi:hypothetical protein
MRALAAFLARLRADTSALSLVEFALTMPVITALGMYGTEVAYMSSVNMQVSQLAVQVADNASRMEQTNTSSVSPTVSEADITSVLYGATKQGGAFNFAANGRVIPLQPGDELILQAIHPLATLHRHAHHLGLGLWRAGTVLTSGLGSGTTKISAASGSAVMFVEVWYKYKGLFGTLFVQPTLFKHESAFLIRDDRNISAGVSGTAANTC